jgi:hypothetical protein
VEALVCSFSLSLSVYRLDLAEEVKAAGSSWARPLSSLMLFSAHCVSSGRFSLWMTVLQYSLFDFRWVVACNDGAVPLEFWAARWVRRYYLHWKLSPETLALWENGVPLGFLIAYYDSISPLCSFHHSVLLEVTITTTYFSGQVK